MRQLLLILGLTLVPGSLPAVEGAPYSYVGAGGSLLPLNPATTDNADTEGGYLKAGHMITPQFGFEVRATRTNTEPVAIDGRDAEVDLNLDSAVSAFARWHLSQQADWAMYLLLGGTTAKARLDGNGAPASEREADWSIGVGVDLYGTPRVALTADVVRYVDADAFDLWGGNLGLQLRF